MCGHISALSSRWDPFDRDVYTGMFHEDLEHGKGSIRTCTGKVITGMP